MAKRQRNYRSAEEQMDYRQELQDYAAPTSSAPFAIHAPKYQSTYIGNHAETIKKTADVLEKSYWANKSAESNMLRGIESMKFDDKDAHLYTRAMNTYKDMMGKIGERHEMAGNIITDTTDELISDSHYVAAMEDKIGMDKQNAKLDAEYNKGMDHQMYKFYKSELENLPSVTDENRQITDENGIPTGKVIPLNFTTPPKTVNINDKIISLKPLYNADITGRTYQDKILNLDAFENMSEGEFKKVFGMTQEQMKQYGFTTEIISHINRTHDYRKHGNKEGFQAFAMGRLLNDPETMAYVNEMVKIANIKASRQAGFDPTVYEPLTVAEYLMHGTDQLDNGERGALEGLNMDLTYAEKLTEQKYTDLLAKQSGRISAAGIQNQNYYKYRVTENVNEVDVTGIEASAHASKMRTDEQSISTAIRTFETDVKYQKNGQFDPELMTAVDRAQYNDLLASRNRHNSEAITMLSTISKVSPSKAAEIMLSELNTATSVVDLVGLYAEGIPEDIISQYKTETKIWGTGGEEEYAVDHADLKAKNEEFVKQMVADGKLSELINLASKAKSYSTVSYNGEITTSDYFSAADIYQQGHEVLSKNDKDLTVGITHYGLLESSTDKSGTRVSNTEADLEGIFFDINEKGFDLATEDGFTLDNVLTNQDSQLNRSFHEGGLTKVFPSNTKFISQGLVSKGGVLYWQGNYENQGVYATQLFIIPPQQLDKLTSDYLRSAQVSGDKELENDMIAIRAKARYGNAYQTDIYDYARRVHNNISDIGGVYDIPTSSNTLDIGNNKMNVVTFAGNHNELNHSRVNSLMFKLPQTGTVIKADGVPLDAQTNKYVTNSLYNISTNYDEAISNAGTMSAAKAKSIYIDVINDEVSHYNEAHPNVPISPIQLVQYTYGSNVNMEVVNGKLTSIGNLINTEENYITHLNYLERLNLTNNNQ